MSKVRTTAVDVFTPDEHAVTELPFPHLNALSSIAPGLLYPHQADGVAFLISKGRAILGNDMGLGSKSGEHPLPRNDSKKAHRRQLARPESTGIH